MREQIDPKTSEVIAKYYSIREITKKFQMSVSSLKKASETGRLYNFRKLIVLFWNILHNITDNKDNDN